ncbi:uncharacterized protein BO66DRAFT_434085 [Aspergillus aculeatinus CBS 121060]|uniref:Uncharacterized protein n=1 Tax=Aspergillus aculeatinus CBS 121060 TaxID=1448322 RepID=A0ACD1HMD1_9EURO|nr:hypothetical protein BO66DRAFT_434085 [Aspergillus aculeatinus CBS 121060]RAH74978.1 hypothetical protein BO66DRAFT_434085 [Aspergillus aculeatinus CBS 121060]
MRHVYEPRKSGQMYQDIVRLHSPDGGDCIAPAVLQNIDRKDDLRWPGARAAFRLLKFEYDGLSYWALSDSENLERFRRDLTGSGPYHGCIWRGGEAPYIAEGTRLTAPLSRAFCKLRDQQQWLNYPPS